MGKGLLFFCCACFILVLTIVNLSIGPIVSGTTYNYFRVDLVTINCKGEKDLCDTAKDTTGHDDDYIKYHQEYDYNAMVKVQRRLYPAYSSLQ